MYIDLTGTSKSKGVLESYAQQQVQEAVVAERERIEAVFIKEVPPHAMDLEDSVWLKRLLNKAFKHN
jgi:hypothetical protein